MKYDAMDVTTTDRQPYSFIGQHNIFKSVSYFLTLGIQMNISIHNVLVDKHKAKHVLNLKPSLIQNFPRFGKQ